MLLINISQIPLEGLELREALVPSEVHVQGEETFALAPGGRLSATSTRWTECRSTCGASSERPSR
jgi:hypothetical protein